VTRSRRARSWGLLGLLASCAVALPWVVPGSAAVAAPAQNETPLPGRSFVFIIEGMTAREALAVPELRQLARAGGMGLMTAAVPAGGAGRHSSAYLTIGSGTPLNDPSSTRAGLMARALAVDNVQVCSQPEGVPMRYLGDGACEAGERVGAASVRVVRLPAPSGSANARAGVLRADGAAIRQRVAQLRNARALVMVLNPAPSAAMDAQGDEVTPLIMAGGPASTLFPTTGATHGLTSASTRQVGLVANTDVAPTVMSFFHLSVPSEMSGDPIEATGGSAPTSLYERQLDYRRIRFPVQIFEVAVVTAAGIIACGLLLRLRRRRTITRRGADAIVFFALAFTAFPLAIFSAGLLPILRYWTVIPYLIVLPLALAALARLVRWPGPYGGFGFIGAVGLVFVLLDLATGAHALRLPLLGGVMFDGTRFYGLPNAAISIVLASALFVAAGLPLVWGTAVLAATALVAGWPWLGADIGGAITLFVAAGLWLGIRRTSGRLRPSGVGIAAVVAVVGTGVVLLANRFLALEPTHATHFLDRPEAASAVFGTLGHRLGVGGRLVADDPAVLVPLLGMIGVLAVVVGRPEPLRTGLRDRRWRDMIGIMVVSAIVAYLVNDTGSSAASPTFLYALAAVLGVTVPAFVDLPPPRRRREPRRKRDERAGRVETPSGTAARNAPARRRRGRRRRRAGR
jgi:hypothetical protein